MMNGGKNSRIGKRCETPGVEDRLDYIKQISEQLAKMASDVELDQLAYYLGLAAQEAADELATHQLRKPSIH